MDLHLHELYHLNKKLNADDFIDSKNITKTQSTDNLMDKYIQTFGFENY